MSDLKPVSRSDGRLIYLAGTSRSGKSRHAMVLASRHKRLLIWDPDDEWSSHGATRIDVNDAARFRDICRRKTAGQYTFVAPATLEWFEFFCQCAWVWLRLYPGAVVVEELADVTSPGKAAGAWGMICRRGKKFGAWIYGISQRPAECDKTAISNADEIHCHAVVRPVDQRYMAEFIGATQDQVAALVPWQHLSRLDIAQAPQLAGDIRPDLAQNLRTKP